MSDLEHEVARHYTRGDLETALLAGLRAIGRSGEDPLSPGDLNGLDEFHIGGQDATADFVGRIGLTDDMEVLDIGSGIGGPARHMAREHGVRVIGIDLTPEYVTVAEMLTQRAGLADRVEFRQGSAAALPFDDEAFDAATLMHVGMNLPDKPAVFASVWRVLRPRGVFAVYDIMRTADGEIDFPVPWATTPSTSFVQTPEAYRQALADAGFTVEQERDRSDFALDFFRRLRARQQADGGPPPLGLHLTMGSNAPQKVANMLSNLESGLIAPIEMLCRRR
jgi:SAM-dependent methyltransferase